MVRSGGFRERNVEVLREAQNALNVAFGAILSAYIGNSLTDIDNRPFDDVLLAHHVGAELGFEVVVLRVLTACWVFGLLGSNAVLTTINYIHHRNMNK